MEDRSDLYIKHESDPGFRDDVVENVTFTDTVIAKIYMILFTNKGDVFGDLDFGADITTFLWNTTFPASTIKDNIIEQFDKYIPELTRNDYTINVYILKGDVRDIGVIAIDLGITNFVAQFK